MDGRFEQILDAGGSQGESAGGFLHAFDSIDTGQAGGILNVYYDGAQPAARSVIDIARLCGSGDLVLEGTSFNTLKWFRLAEGAADSFRGNLTICNYSAAWDGLELYDTAAVLELGRTEMPGSLSLDVAGYCAPDCFFIAAVGLAGDVSIGGLDAPDYIAPAAFLYSGSLGADTTSLDHAEGLGAYITPEAHTLTIHTGGEHHFHGQVLNALTLVKTGSGTQGFTGALADGCTFEVLGGVLSLACDTQAAGIRLDGGTLSHTGNLGTQGLSMQDGRLSVSGLLSAGQACFSGCNELGAGCISGGSWEIGLGRGQRSGEPGARAALALLPASRGQLEALHFRYDQGQMLRGWYCAVGNGTGLDAVQVLANGRAARTEWRGEDLWVYVADGGLTLPRPGGATLTWLPDSGVWETGRGHAECAWDGPELNSNFLAGDSVCFLQEAAVWLQGELSPGRVEVGNACGRVVFGGSGSICGEATLLKDGPGQLSIHNANTFTGGTILSGGSLLTAHGQALGCGAVRLLGGRLDMGGQALQNSICIEGEAEIDGGGQYAGRLELVSGTLRGSGVQLCGEALLGGGGVAAPLSGSGGVRVRGVVGMDCASSYTGNTVLEAGSSLSLGHAQALGGSRVVMQGGQLDLCHHAAANALQVRGEASLLNAGNFRGSIDLQSGTLRVDSLGRATLACSGSATLQAGDGELCLTSPIRNSGTLTLAGCFELTALGSSLDATRVDAYGTRGGQSGFQQDAGTVIRLATGSGSIGGGATFLYRGSEVTPGADGLCHLGATTHYGEYHIAPGHQVSVSDIRAVAGEALRRISMSGGQLVADAGACLAAEGGEILLSAGELTGCCSGVGIAASGGALRLSFRGENQVSSSSGAVQIAAPLSNSGTLTLLGEFDASALPLEQQAATRTGGTSPASGFAREAALSLQVVSGGGVCAGGAVILHGQHRLTLGADGCATAGGRVDYSQYLLTGTDTARLSGIEHPELQVICMTGGTLTADADTARLQATAGTVLLEKGCISSSLGGSTRVIVTGRGSLAAANTHTGGTLLENGHLTLSAAGALGCGPFAASGNSRLTVEGFTLALQAPLENSGQLLLEGSFDATALARSTEACMVDAYGNEGGSSGFCRDAGCELQLTTGGSVNTASASILLHGQRITPDSAGHASLPGSLHTDTYTIAGDHCVSSADIAAAAGGAMPAIRMSSGTLRVNTSTDKLTATGGLVLVENAHLAGTLGGSTRLEVLADAVLGGEANTYTGGTCIRTGSLRITHAGALGCGPVHLGSNSPPNTPARAAATPPPTLDLANLPVGNLLHLSGSSSLRGLENFHGSITMDQGAETTIQSGDVLTLGAGQTLTLAPGGNTIHGHLNLAGGRIIITGGTLTLHGVVNFSQPTTIDLSQLEATPQGPTGDLLVFDFPSACDEQLLEIILPGHLQDGDISFNPQTGALQLNPGPGDAASTGRAEAASLAASLNHNQRAAYEALRRIPPDTTSGELARLAAEAASSTDAAAMRRLMDLANGAGYTSLPNSVADDAHAQLRRLRDLAGTAHRLAPHSNTAVLIHAFNSTSSTTAQTQGYDRSAWGGQLIAEQQLHDKLCLGLALASGQTRITPAGGSEHTDTATHLGGYALCTHRKWRFLLAAGLGLHEFSLSRRSSDGSTCEVEGAGASSVNICGEASREFTLNTRSTLCPYLALQSTTATVDSFHETGSTAALHAARQNATLTELTLGLHYRTHRRTLQLGLHGALTATVGDTRTALDLHFHDAPDQGFTVRSGKRRSLGCELGGSLALPLGPACQVHAATSLHLQGNTHYLDTQLGIILPF